MVRFYMGRAEPLEFADSWARSREKEKLNMTPAFSLFGLHEQQFAPY